MLDGPIRDLVVAFNFPPFSDGSAVTVAKRILASDRRVDVISADLSSIRRRDESLWGLVEPLVAEHHALNVPVRFAQMSSVDSFVKQGLARLAHRSEDPYGSVYSRSMWPHSHFLAAAVRAQELAQSWTAEFSDPLLWQSDGTRRPSAPVRVGPDEARLLRAIGARGQRLLLDDLTVMAWAQNLPFLLADTLVFTNDQQRAVTLADAPEWLRLSVEQRSVVSPHPTLPEQYYVDDGAGGPRRDDTFRIGYFGTFYPNRGGGDFLQALSLLSPDERRRIRLDVYSDDAAALRRAAARLGLGRQIAIRRPLPLLEFLPRTQRYDALLVNDISSTPFTVPSPFLPSKYSDYAGSSTPTMALTIPGSPLDLAHSKWKAHVGDIDAIASMLRAATHEKLGHGAESADTEDRAPADDS